jgi:hypothetical protein
MEILQTLLGIKTVDHQRNTDVKENVNVQVITSENDDCEMRCLWHPYKELKTRTKKTMEYEINDAQTNFV